MKESTHSFDVAIAVKLGSTEKAILLKEVLGWQNINKANKRNFHDNRFWTYNSAEAYAKKFPYMKRRSIARWLKELVKNKWMYEGEFSQNPYDKTKSHSVNEGRYLKAIKEYFTDENQNVQPIGQNGQSKGQNSESVGQDGQYTSLTPSPTSSPSLSLGEKTESADQFLSADEIAELDSKTGKAGNSPLSSAPPPSIEPTVGPADNPVPTLLEIEDQTVEWLENDYIGRQKWAQIKRSTGAKENELTDPRKTVQAALSICGDYVFSSPRIIRNKLLGCAGTQLKIERKSKNEKRKTSSNVRSINEKKPKEDYSQRESWGC